MSALIHFVADVYIFIIIIRVILSWIDHNPSNSLIQLVYQITEPPLNWIRSFVPSLGGLDISPLILILAIYVLESILTRIF
jgi:YggT family protein